MNTILIGIAGGTGSGKTTLADKLIDSFGDDEVSILRHDNYYKRHDDMCYEERSKLNYDHPDAFDTALLCEHICKLKAGEQIYMPVYDYSIHNRSEETILVKPAPVIVLEGILIFAEPSLCDLMDIKVFVDTDADVRILRRIIRDVKERGRSLDSVINQYLTTVKPMHEQFVEPSKRRADIIIPEGGENIVALDMLIERKHAKRITSSAIKWQALCLPFFCMQDCSDADDRRCHNLLRKSADHRLHEVPDRNRYSRRSRGWSGSSH